MFVFTCPTLSDLDIQPTGVMSADSFPTCATGSGVWVHVADLPTSSSWATTLTLTDAAALIGASMFAVVVAWGFRQVFDFTQNRR